MDVDVLARARRLWLARQALHGRVGDSSSFNASPRAFPWPARGLATTLATRTVSIWATGPRGRDYGPWPEVAQLTLDVA